MKVCTEHLSELPRGTTYQVVPKEQCEICTVIKQLITERNEW